MKAPKCCDKFMELKCVDECIMVYVFQCKKCGEVVEVEK